ncbi:MAG: hypothetical protein M5U08_11765 [Burkholderiales bacterium]|nr:hypothetical protein [Burkholderiales bacterium]
MPARFAAAHSRSVAGLGISTAFARYSAAAFHHFSPGVVKVQNG